MTPDARPQVTKRFKAALHGAGANRESGPVGAFKTLPFDTATTELAKKAAQMIRNGNAVSVAGGGDTVSALIYAQVKADFTCVASAGGAFLESLKGKTVPEIAAE